MTRLVIAFLLAVVPGIALADVVGKPVVMDGDTMLFGAQEVQLRGVRAPLITQNCGASGEVWSCGWDAALYLERQIGERTVTCVDAGPDEDGTLLARCLVDGRDLAGAMIDAGFAVPDAERGGAYVARSAAAADDERGMWSGPFVDPAVWAERSSCSCGARKKSIAQTAERIRDAGEADNVPDE